MIIEYGGGNDGIAEYLVTGYKADREYTRDQIDQRVIIFGDLSVTKTIIDSISDKGQKRYLHITLSFAEDDISTETLTEITEEYRKFLMNAWHEDEYNFYAEAHLPKMKNIIDNKTGKPVTRKPHLHLVIPRINLLTGRAINPVGDLTKKSSQQQLDAIQEHINRKFSLISPKDVPRVSDDNLAQMLSRIKGDYFRERHAKKKTELLDKMESENIRTVQQFTELLSQYGEIKIRNSGRKNQYFAVKFSGDNKFTNLKNPVFSKLYIEKRALPLVKPNETQTANLIATWLTKTSHEIRFIWPASKKVRDTYKKLDEDSKIIFLQDRRKSYAQKYNIKSADTARTGRWQTGYQRSTKPVTRGYHTEKTIGLPRMPPRGLVYGIQGRRPEESHGVLLSDEKRYMAEHRRKGKYSGGNVRWYGIGRGKDELSRRGIKQISQSSVLHEIIYQHQDQQAYDDENTIFNNIKKTIDPERFLAEMQRRFYINTQDHKVSYTSDNSPRFAAGKRNLNVCDFLTKYINLSWQDARELLSEIYQAQKENTHFEKPAVIMKLTAAESRRRLESLRQTGGFLHAHIRQERNRIFNELKIMRKNIYAIAQEENIDIELVKGVIVYKKLAALDVLNNRITRAKNEITHYHFNWNQEKHSMKALDTLKKILLDEDENSIGAAEPEVSLKKAIEANRRRESFAATNVKMKDLIRRQKGTRIEYISPHTEQPVFTDIGLSVITKSAGKEEIALMLEYAKEKYGGFLKIKGTEEFKIMCAKVAAEKNMNIILRPAEYNDLMKEIKSTLQIHEKEIVKEGANAISQAEPQQQPAIVQPVSEAVQQKSHPEGSATAPQPAAGAPQQEAQPVIPAGESALTGKQYSSHSQQTADQPAPREFSDPPMPQAVTQPAKRAEPVWLSVPFNRKNEAKKLGARWDTDKKLWYVPPGEETAPFRDFFPENQPVPPQMDPREEFAMALKDAGLIIDGLPEMDGQLHRVPVKGAENKKDGAYVGYPDGHPAGFIQNFKSGYTDNWKAAGTYVPKGNREQFITESKAKKQAAELNLETAYDLKAQEITEKINRLPDAPPNHPYLKAKGLDNEGHAFGAKQDEQGNLVIPLQDEHGRIWSMQKITSSGFKQYEKGGKVNGNFLVIGNEQEIKNSEQLFISTGFGTSAAIHAATNKPVIASFQDGNLEKIARLFHTRYPEKTIVIMGDDDRHLTEQGKINSGREKALAAAKATNGIAIFPNFNEQEKGREFTDFADLYRVHGSEAVLQQTLKIIQPEEVMNKNQREIEQERQRQQEENQPEAD